MPILAYKERGHMLRPLVWVGSSLEDLKRFSEDVQDEVGYTLYQAQLGYFPTNVKFLKGFYRRL